MAEITWIKLKTDMFDNNKIRLIEKLPEGDTILVIWIKLLAAAGKANCNGYIMITENVPMHIEEMAALFDRPLNTVRLAIEAFKRYGMIEMDDNEIVRINNWEKHQNVDGMEKIRLQTAARVQKHRAKQKVENTLPAPKSNDSVTCNVTVTQSNETEREEERELDIDLEIDKEKEKDREKDREKENQSVTPSLIDNNFLAIKNFFDSTIRISNFTDHKKMDKLLEFTPDSLLIIEAMKVTADKGKSNMEYVEAILRNWRTEQGVTTYTDWQVKINAKDGRSDGNGNGGTTSEKPSVFGNYCSD